jgi:amino acid permease
LLTNCAQSNDLSADAVGGNATGGQTHGNCGATVAGGLATEAAGELASYEAADLKLRKTMGRTQLTALSLGGIIGSGWLFAVLDADSVAGPASMFSWLIGGICVLFIAFTYMEISAMLPRTGALSRYPSLTQSG